MSPQITYRRRVSPRDMKRRPAGSPPLYRGGGRERPEAFERATARRRSDEPLTYQDFVSSHKRRFALLKISGPTQAELLAALDFTWKALRDPEIPSEKREAAEKIRDLMVSMGGPPPCCDDSIFERAGMAD